MKRARRAKLFQQFFARPHRRPGEPHFPNRLEGRGCWWDDPGATALAAGRGFNVKAVGEAQFQAEIGSIVGGRCEEGHACEVPAELVLAGDDRDPEAIGILINSRPVGRLPDEISALVRPPLIALMREGKPVTCRAKIVGGWDRGIGDRGYFGVKLSLSLPLKRHRAAARREKPATPDRLRSDHRMAASR